MAVSDKAPMEIQASPDTPVDMVADATSRRGAAPPLAGMCRIQQAPFIFMPHFLPVL